MSGGFPDRCRGFLLDLGLSDSDVTQQMGLERFQRVPLPGEGPYVDQCLPDALPRSCAARYM